MKELSIEEKAKRYDEALGKARRYYDEYKTRDNILYVEDMEDMFPELKESKESEDEKIKGAAIEFVRQNKSFNYRLGISKEEVIAWLEKQGKRDARNKYLEELLEADTIYQMAMNDAMVEEAKNKAIKALQELAVSKLLGLEKQGGQILANSAKTCKDEQNHAWSEEDEAVLNALIRKLEGEDVHVSPHLAAECLKSLKDRIKGG